MEHRLELERRGRDPVQVLELTLDNCRVNGSGDAISPKLGEYVNLEKLRMINIGLTSLKGFPHLSSLKRLDISDNHLSGTLNFLADACPNLQSLNMGGNHIRDLEALTPLKSLTKLRHLDLFNCDIMMLDDYRGKVLGLLPQLTDLDSFDRDNREVEDSEDDDDDASADEDAENDSDEENMGDMGDQQEYENGLGSSESEEEPSEEEEDDENDDSGLLNIQLDENGIGIPKYGQENAPNPVDANEYDDDYDDEEATDEETENEISFDQSPVPESHPQGLKRPHSDDEEEVEENAADVEPDDLGPGENSNSL